MLRGLDPDQRTAVTAPVGVTVVRAGAGSGKTTVLTRRIAWRTLSDTADIERTLAITFTRQAATEMRTRLAGFDLDGRPTIGTFHAVARQMMMQLLADASRPVPVIINNRASLMSTCMGDDARRGGITEMLSAIDWAHCQMLDPREAPERMKQAGLQVPLGQKRFGEVFEAYERAKKKRGVVDLNDMLTFVVRETMKNPRNLESLRFQFRHISVDEAQDMNPLQYEFLKMLVGDRADVFLVGDPNQAIYGFNGADRDLFTVLPGIDAPAHVVTLPSNYRCTPEIVDFASRTLTRQGQEIAAVSRRPGGAPVELHRFPTSDDEITSVTRSLARVADPGALFRTAVLCRTNALAERVRDACARAAIPVASARRGGEWSRAVGTATQLTGREALTTWSSDVLESGDYSPDDADHEVALLVRRFLDDNRIGSVDGRTFGAWLATSADIASDRGVEIVTFHAAKGREWDTVHVVGCEKGLLPHRGARGTAAREEETRLAYVAFTRAADRLIVSWCDSRDGRQAGPSPLLPALSTSVPAAAAPTEEFRRRRTSQPTSHPLRIALEQWRSTKSHQQRVAPETLLTDRQIRDLVRAAPANEADIAEHTDPVFARLFADEILAAVRESTSG